MARTKASIHRDSTGNYMSSSGSEIGSEDDMESYQLDPTQALKPGSHASDSYSTDVLDVSAGELSAVNDPETYPDQPLDTEQDEEDGDDEQDEEDSDSEEEDEEEEEEGSERARSRSVSSRASTIPPELLVEDSMSVDPTATDASTSVHGKSPTDGVIPISPTSHIPGTSTPGRKKGLDGPLSPLSPTSSPVKPPHPTDSPPLNSQALGDVSVPTPDSPPKKSKIKRPKAPSPETQLPPPPPIETIRLSFPLQGPDNYQVDVADEARKAGLLPMAPIIPIVTIADTEDSADEGEGEKKHSDSAPLPKEHKKRKRNTDTYDKSDPFIDDSLLDQDERKYIAQTKQTGFYVSSGEVALLKEATPKKTPKPRSTVGGHPDELNGDSKLLAKRKAKALPLTAAGLLAQPLPGRERTDSGIGTVDSPIDLSASNAPMLDNSIAVPPESAHSVTPIDGEIDYDPTAGIGKKRKRYVYVGGPGSIEGGKRRKVVAASSFHPTLQLSIKELEAAIGQQDWSNKAKFPPDLKPALARVAIQAIQLDEYDEDFFALMPTIFPYNKFTMTKLIKRTIFPDHIKLLIDRQDALLQELKRQADEGFSKAEDEHTRAVMLWEKRQGKTHNSHGDDSCPPINGSDGVITRPHTPPPLEDGDDPMDGTGMGEESAPATAQQSAALKRDQNPPLKKYRLTETMRAIIWELVLLSNECVRLENEKNQLESSVIIVSEQAARKTLYQKIVGTFPEGWMSSGHISRDVSAIKKKLEKESEAPTEVAPH